MGGGDGRGGRETLDLAEIDAQLASITEWMKGWGKGLEEEEDEVEWYDCVDRIMVTDTPEHTREQMTPNTPKHSEHESFAPLTLPPPQQPIVAPIFTFSAPSTPKASQKRQGRNVFKTQALPTILMNTTAHVGLGKMTQPLGKPGTRTMGTQISECGCLRCTPKVNKRCKWRIIAMNVHFLVTKQLVQRRMITVLHTVAVMWRTKKLNTANVVTQTPKNMGKAKVRSVSSQAKPAQGTAETQTVQREKLRIKSDAAVQTSLKGDAFMQTDDRKKKGFSKTSALQVPNTVTQSGEISLKGDVCTQLGQHYEDMMDRVKSKILAQLDAIDVASKQSGCRARTDSDRIKEEEGGRNWPYR